MSEEQMIKFFASKEDLRQLEVRMDTKIDTKLTNLKDDILTVLDKQTVILQRLDQERVFTNERIHTLERDVQQIKIRLAIA